MENIGSEPQCCSTPCWCTHVCFAIDGKTIVSSRIYSGTNTAMYTQQPRWMWSNGAATEQSNTKQQAQQQQKLFNMMPTNAICTAHNISSRRMDSACCQYYTRLGSGERHFTTVALLLVLFTKLMISHVLSTSFSFCLRWEIFQHFNRYVRHILILELSIVISAQQLGISISPQKQLVHKMFVFFFLHHSCLSILLYIKLHIEHKQWAWKICRDMTGLNSRWIS